MYFLGFSGLGNSSSLKFKYFLALTADMLYLFANLLYKSAFFFIFKFLEYSFNSKINCIFFYDFQLVLNDVYHWDQNSYH